MASDPEVAPIPGRYGALLILLVISYLMSAFITATWIGAVQVVLFTAAIYHFSGDKFFATGEVANTQTFQYFSYTTLTTLGYGDYTAKYSSGQATAVLEALTGQIFLATLVARLVAAYRSERRG